VRATSTWARVTATVIVLAVLALTVWLVRQGTRPRNWGERFRYDLSAIKQIDSKHMTGREVAPIPAGVTNPHALATDRSNRVYVGGDTAIAILETDGRAMRQIATDRPVTCLAIGRDGLIYAGLTDSVAVFTPEGIKRAEWQAPGTNAVLTSIGVNDTDLFAADAGQRIVWRFDLTGNLLAQIGAKDPNTGFPGFFIPSPYFDLAFAPDGALWVVDPGRHKFIHFSPDGEVLSSWERTGTDIEGFSGCCNPSHIAIRSDGSFVTSEKGVVRVKLHTATGTLAGVLAGPARFGPDTRGLDLAVDSTGRILVLDPDRALILVFMLEDK
jgi:sugar lactone lactonase YvrE